MLGGTFNNKYTVVCMVWLYSCPLVRRTLLEIILSLYSVLLGNSLGILFSSFSKVLSEGPLFISLGPGEITSTLFFFCGFHRD